MYCIRLLIKLGFFGILFFLVSCQINSHTDEKPLARVYDRYLYPSDLKGIIPLALSDADSSKITEQYINNWIQENVLLEQAELNLENDQLDFEKKLKKYKNSLIIYAYEQALINEQLDTVVSDKEIAKYYELNVQNFLLTRPVYKLRYVKIEKEHEEINLIRDWIRSSKQEERDELEEFCISNSILHYLNDSVWIEAETIHNEIPAQKEMNFFRAPGTGLFELKDEVFTYFIFVVDVLKKDEISPIEVASSDVKTLILNNRKKELLKKMRKDIYNEALRKNEVEINP